MKKRFDRRVSSVRNTRWRHKLCLATGPAWIISEETAPSGGVLLDRLSLTAIVADYYHPTREATTQTAQNLRHFCTIPPTGVSTDQVVLRPSEIRAYKFPSPATGSFSNRPTLLPLALRRLPEAAPRQELSTMRSTSLVTTRSTSPVIRAVSRWVLGTAGILWVAIAASLCGCSPIAPVNGWAMNQRGKSLYKRGDYAKARSEFERALMDSPYSADYAFNVAAAMDQQGDHLAAEKMYRHALTRDPGHQPAYHGLAAMMLEDGRTTEATDLVNTWAVTQPYSEEAATELGWLKTEQGDLAGADVELRRALRQNPRNTRSLAQLGRVHSKTGRREDAASDYARSLFMDPNQPETQSELAALGQGAYGDPALQMATAMPLYDPLLQATPYPAFTSPQTQSQLAGSPTSDQHWTGAPAGMQATSYPMNESPFPTQASWTHSPMQPMPQMMNGQSPYPTLADPVAVSGPYSPPQFYNASRPSTSFFQPQQSFHGSVPGSYPGAMLSSAPMSQPEMMSTEPTPVSGMDAPTWNSGQPTPMPLLVPGNPWSTPPAMNASYGTGLPTEQISSVPVVPAF